MKAYLIAGAALAALAAAPAFAQAGGDAPMTRAAIQQRIQEQFAAHDANHDNFIDRQELGDDADEALERLDTDHDGKLSLEEVSTVALSHFDAADTDHDGTLTEAEREAAMARMDQPPAQPQPEQPQGN
ncbi:hypothetical protein GCM10023232_18630 [Sphingosinicella ginsenosidimutans]|uniref:EF-hand domain-containing protein n=1 Tax=Allosphingosinicella ginsenosidimutans TaxID=1176539 RepID=A0A5C6TT73_9SPHN|nr:EF-hand domain-containing protein [Sphingosinicella ginsenosidimutans]TXC62908.1 hypothetical protein FRZ32_04030 [Sphingosinicella ginsenosidimutans]